MRDMSQQAASSAMVMGPMVHLQGMQLPRPIELVRAPTRSVDDKRAILAGLGIGLLRGGIESRPSPTARNDRAGFNR